MEHRRALVGAIPARTLAVMVASASAIVIASLVFLWPTFRWLHPAVVHPLPRPAATYASYDVVAESENDAFALQQWPSGVGSPSANLYRTQDAGATWHRIALPALPSPVDLVVTRLPGGELLMRSFGISTGAPVFYVGDGARWTQITLPDQGTGSLEMINAHLGFYVVTQTARTPSVQELVIYRTMDGGSSWEQRLALTTDHPDAGGLRLSDSNRFIAFSDALHAWLVVVPPAWGIECGTPSTTDPAQELMATQDGGATWTPVPLPDLPRFSTELGPPFFPNAGGAGFLTVTVNRYVGQCPPVGVTYAYTTLDGGAIWSGPERLPAPIFDSPDGIVWWASDGSTLFRSNNQGQGWKTIKPRHPAAAVSLVELSAIDAQTAWSVWSEGNDQSQPQPEALLRTTDAGIHWSEVRVPGG